MQNFLVVSESNRSCQRILRASFYNHRNVSWRKINILSVLTHYEIRKKYHLRFECSRALKSILK